MTTTPAVWAMIGLLSAALLNASDSGSPLADAAQQKNGRQVRELLKAGSDPNTAQVDGMTALHWAVHLEDLKTAELLLAAGADAQAANRYGVRPLSLACLNGNVGLADLLLNAGADPNAGLPGGETPLMTAARTGKSEVVRRLLAAGADVHAREERRGQTAFVWAAAEGHTAVVEDLMRAGVDFRTALESGLTPLLLAVRNGRLGVVRALLQAGADPNQTLQAQGRSAGYGGRVRKGSSALLLAVLNGHFEVAAELLEAGADPNADLPGFTVLHLIPSVRKPGVGDNDPAPKGSGHMTSIEFVRKLAAAGADLNARMGRSVNLGNTSLNKLGATPFFLAAHAADAELMRVLVELGADPFLTNANKSTPLMAAAGLGTRSPGEDAGTESEVLEALRLLLELGADINAVDGNGETAMHAAAYKNLPRVVEFLAGNGAAVDTWYRENAYGWTPLTIAAGYRFGNFKPSPETEKALRQVLLAAGLTPPEKIVGTTRQIY